MEGAEAVVLVDSSVLISCGRRETRVRALAREAHQRETQFRIPPRVYSEVTGDPAREAYTAGGSLVDEALREGWMTVTESPSYADPSVSNVMDQARRFIASASGREEDVIEKADTEIVGLALEMLRTDAVDRIVVVTNDVPLGEAVESLLPQTGSTTNRSRGSLVVTLPPNSTRISSPNSSEASIGGLHRGLG